MFAISVMVKRTTFIYTLSDPSSMEVRYVGKTVDPKQRLRQHIHSSKKRYLSSWIKSLAINGKSPLMEVIDQSDDDWESLERFYISYFKFLGVRLTNLTDGGDGQHGRVVSQESRMKMRLSHLGRRTSESTRLALSKALTGRVLSKETRDKISKANTGKKLPPLSVDRKNKISKSLLGRSMSLKTKMALRRANAGRKMSAETKKKIGEANSNKVFTIEHRTAISSALMGKKKPPRSEAHMENWKKSRNKNKKTV